MVKKAQIAMEFLMTYGWAMLVILIAVGALVYFGVAETDSILPERCEFAGQGLTCEDTPGISKETGQVLLLIKNTVGQSVNLTSVSATDDCTVNSFEFCSTDDSCNGPDEAKIVANGQDFIVSVNCSESLSGRFRSDFTIYYTNMETGLNSYNLGQVRGNVD